MRVKLSSKVLNQVANEPFVYQKVTLVSIPEFIWSCSVYDFFNCSDSNRLGMLNQEADGGHIGASYVLDLISIFNGG
ncbi:hypothetical protein H5410_003901 [Solanum commersonii]|uniref:Uncharacterized protein n=1 Tax=Solanum commersonii TaxID=4109 RepID=A0A9J6B6A3_SOLCO|nr:hypothetical protein H5410_003901 [Solanum commersonii]